MQRVVIDKKAGICVGHDDFADARSDLAPVDPSFYDTLLVPDGTIAAGDPTEKYFRNAQGQIVKRPAAELVQFFNDERLKAEMLEFRNDVDALGINVPDAVKTFLKKLVARTVR